MQSASGRAGDARSSGVATALGRSLLSYDIEASVSVPLSPQQPAATEIRLCPTPSTSSSSPWPFLSLSLFSSSRFRFVFLSTSTTLRRFDGRKITNVLVLPYLSLVPRSPSSYFPVTRTKMQLQGARRQFHARYAPRKMSSGEVLVK